MSEPHVAAPGEMDPRGPGDLTDAQRAYGEYLLSLGEADPGSFEAYCASRPELEEALREVAFEWTELFDLEPTPEASPELAALLLGRYGADLSVRGSGSSERDRAPEPRFVPLTPTDPRYRLADEIGRGGMGAILVAEDRNLQRRVAMKVLLGRAVEGVEQATVSLTRLGRFLEEARVTGALAHPNIVPVHELGLDETGNLFFTMRLVRGRDLTHVFDLARRGEQGWTLRRALEVLLRVSQVVALAHSRGITHRDLKPANVLVGDFGEVYCLDWGLAHREGNDSASVGASGDGSGPAASGSANRTLDGTVLGTPAYMSPEQALGRPEATGPHSDVYGLGAMLYRLLSGNAPFVERGSATPPRKVIDALLFGELEPIEVHEPRTPPELVAICEKAMARDPRSRYPGAKELAEELRAYLEGRVVRSFESGAWAELRKWVGRHRGFSTAFLAALLIVFACFGLFTYLTERSTRELTLLLDADLRQYLALREPDLWPVHPDRREGMRRWLDVADELAGRQADHEARLAQWEGELTSEDVQASDLIDKGEKSLTLALELTGARRRTVWRYLTQRDLVGRLEELYRPGGAYSIVRKELQRATALDRDVEWTEAWRVSSEAIASSPWYDGLELRPQLGLVPIGPDPVTGLWEFGHWLSGEVPRREEGEPLDPQPGSGVVFVLLPGGVFEQGSHQETDPWARSEEEPAELVALAPFFLSKYEVTEGQLYRLLPGTRQPAQESDLLPAVVELSVSRAATRRHFLDLPTEAQLEYATRAGTTTPWWTGDTAEEVEQMANLLGTNRCDRYPDEVAPVGSFPPNPFGLHDVHGNLSEWCQDSLGAYVVPPQAGDGFRFIQSGSQTVRGGNYRLAAPDARSARRMELRQAKEMIGFRPVRAIDPRVDFVEENVEAEE